MEDCEADIHAINTYGQMVVVQAAFGGHLAVLKYLVEKGGNMHASDNDRYTALMRAAGNGHFEVVKYLGEDCEADIHATNTGGNTALLLAASGGACGGGQVPYR